MKTKLLLFLAIWCGVISAQNLTMTQAAYEPIVGDFSNKYNLDTSFYTSGLPSNISGNGVTWDFSNLAVTPTVMNTNFVSPSSLTVTAPAGSTYAEDQNGSYSFFKSVTSPTTQTELLSLKVGTLSLNFTNSGIVARYPISYGYSLADAVSGTVLFPPLLPTFNGTVTTTADGQGTLLMPQGNTFTNVLRLKSVQVITVTAIPIGTVATINQTIYNYYSLQHKFPILTINNTSNTFSTTTTKVTTATGNASFLAIGLKENSLNSVNFNVYPNPAINSVTVLLENNRTAESLTLINSIGQKIKTCNNSNQLHISDLPRGIYYLEVRSNDQSGRKPLVITE